MREQADPLAEFETARQREGLRLIPPVRRSLTVLTPDQLGDGDSRGYIIKGLVGAGDHVILMGHPGCGKSTLAPAIGYFVALGLPVFGRRVRAGPVLYVASEDPHGMKNRVRALRNRHGVAPAFHLAPDSIDLSAPDERDVAALKDLINRIRPVLIVLDTMGKAFGGCLRENESDDMGLLIRVVREMSAVCNSAMVSICHLPKTGEPTPRGHGSLFGDADATLLVEGNRLQVRTVTMGKNRNGPSDFETAFAVETAELGIDEDGDLITAPLAVEADAPTTSRVREAKLPDGPALLLRVIRNIDPRLLEDIRPEPDMPICRCVERRRLRDLLVGQAWFTEAQLSDDDAKLKATKAGLTAESNALRLLKRRGFINFNREWVWAT